jgi:hypothetical protein
MTTEVAKSQWVRIWDIVGLAPIQMYIGSKYPMKLWEKLFMIGAGAGTLLFNLKFLMEDKGYPKSEYKGIPAKMSTTYTYPENLPRMIMGNRMRLYDIFAYGPILLWIAAKYKMETWEEIFMWYAGFSTIYLNYMNYKANRRNQNGAV